MTFVVCIFFLYDVLQMRMTNSRRLKVKKYRYLGVSVMKFLTWHECYTPWRYSTFLRGIICGDIMCWNSARTVSYKTLVLLTTTTNLLVMDWYSRTYSPNRRDPDAIKRHISRISLKESANPVPISIYLHKLIQFTIVPLCPRTKRWVYWITSIYVKIDEWILRMNLYAKNSWGNFF